MIKLTINSQKEGTFWLEKQTQAEVDAYIQWAYESAHWGEPAYTEIIPEVLEIKDELGEVIQTAVPAHDIVHPAEYTIEVTDITAQVSYDKDIAKRVARITFGIQLFAELATRNVIRLKAGTATLAELISAEEKLAKVQRLLGNSSTEVGLQTLENLVIPEIPSSEKTYFIDKIKAYLAAE